MSLGLSIANQSVNPVTSEDFISHIHPLVEKRINGGEGSLRGWMFTLNTFDSRFS